MIIPGLKFFYQSGLYRPNPDPNGLESAKESDTDMVLVFEKHGGGIRSGEDTSNTSLAGYILFCVLSTM